MEIKKGYEFLNGVRISDNKETCRSKFGRTISFVRFCIYRMSKRSKK